MGSRARLAVAVVLCAGASLAPASDTLAQLLAAIADAARLTTTLVAEGKADIDGLKGKSEDRIVLVERSSGDASSPTQILAAFDAAKARVLALAPGEIHLALDGKPKRAASDASLPASSFTAEDFLPFAPARCAAMRIADSTDQHFTILCEPKRPPSQYMLMVYKFDRETASLRQVLLYKETQSNLVKMIRYDDYTQLGNVWRPKRVVLQDFKVRTKDTLALEWRAGDVNAAVFDPKAFAAAALPGTPGAKKP